eukprot:1490519-Rhodomonas_salina.1
MAMRAPRPGCRRQPSFGSEKEGVLRYCRQHTRPDHASPLRSSNNRLAALPPPSLSPSLLPSVASTHCPLPLCPHPPPLRSLQQQIHLLATSLSALSLLLSPPSLLSRALGLFHSLSLFSSWLSLTACGSRCQALKCTRQAVFGSAARRGGGGGGGGGDRGEGEGEGGEKGGKEAVFCRRHKQLHHVNIRYKPCQ